MMMTTTIKTIAKTTTKKTFRKVVARSNCKATHKENMMTWILRIKSNGQKAFLQSQLQAERKQNS